MASWSPPPLVHRKGLEHDRAHPPLDGGQRRTLAQGHEGRERQGRPFGWVKCAEMSPSSDRRRTRIRTGHRGTAPSDTVGRLRSEVGHGDIPENGKPAPAWTWKPRTSSESWTPRFETPGPSIDVNAFKGPLYVSQGTADEVWLVTRGRQCRRCGRAISSRSPASSRAPNTSRLQQADRRAAETTSRLCSTRSSTAA